MLTVGGALLFPPPQACNARATAAATAGLRSRVRRLVIIADMLLVLRDESDFTHDKIGGESNLFLGELKLA